MLFQLLKFVLRQVYHLVGPEGVARGEDALTLLENSQSRNQFIDELMEVKRKVLYVSNYPSEPVLPVGLCVEGNVVGIMIVVL